MNPESRIIFSRGLFKQLSISWAHFLGSFWYRVLFLVLKMIWVSTYVLTSRYRTVSPIALKTCKTISLCGLCTVKASIIANTITWNCCPISLFLRRRPLHSIAIEPAYGPSFHFRFHVLFRLVLQIFVCLDHPQWPRNVHFFARKSRSN